MARKLVLGSIVLIVVVVAGGALLVRSWLDPESVRQTLERQASAALGQPVSIGRADLAIWPRAGVTLHDLTVGEPAAVTLTRTSLSTALSALVNRRVEDAELLVEDSTVDLPLLLATLDRLSSGGGASGPSGGASEAAPSAAEDTGLTLVNVRAISLRNIRVQAGPRSAIVSLQSSLGGDRLEVERATVESEVTTLEATGAIDSLAGRRATLAVTAESLDLDGLLVFAQEFARQALPSGGGATSSGAATSAAGPLDITLEISAAKGRAGGAAFVDLKATTRVTPGQVALAPLSLGVFGGRVNGDVRANLSAADPELTVEAALENVDMALVTAFAGQADTMTGTLSGTMTVEGGGVDATTALARARGTGRVSVRDGSMKGLQLVRPIVLAFGKPDAAQPVDGGERFDRLDAAFTLAGGVVTFTTVTFASRDVELDGDGRLNLSGGTIDLDANARLSKELTAQAGRDLVRYTADDGRVTVPARVTGTFESPQVTVDVGNLLRRAAGNEMRRQADELKEKGESAIRGLLRRKKG